MVDELQHWPNARRPFNKGSCHLTTDGTLDELHAFADRIGLLRTWFQEHWSAPHYDLTPGKRAEALLAGAVFVSAREQAKARIAKRAASQ
jgi:hypothetical protein